MEVNAVDASTKTYELIMHHINSSIYGECVIAESKRVLLAKIAREHAEAQRRVYVASFNMLKEIDPYASVQFPN